VRGMGIHPLFTRTAIADEHLVALTVGRDPEQSNLWLTAAFNSAHRAAEQFGFSPKRILAGGSCSLVYAGECGPTPAVLKVIREPEDGEIDFLIAVQGGPVPNLHGVTADRTAYLMGYIDDTGGEITAVQVRDLATQIQRPTDAASNIRGKVEHRIVYAMRDTEGHPAVQAADIPVALQLIEILTATASRNVILHGDLLRRNLIPTSAGPIAFDPLPAIGDPDIDLARYLAWRGHTRPIHEEWGSVSTPRIDLWAWAYSVLHRNDKDPQRDAREEIIDEIRVDVLRIVGGTLTVPR
jgi:hypothetical protein